MKTDDEVLNLLYDGGASEVEFSTSAWISYVNVRVLLLGFHSPLLEMSA